MQSEEPVVSFPVVSFPRNETKEPDGRKEADNDKWCMCPYLPPQLMHSSTLLS